jgi:hypothetical protein
VQPLIGSSHKRGARNNKKTKGRSHLKELEGDNEISPARSMSRDIQKHAEEPVPAPTTKSNGSEAKQASKAKAAVAPKMSMTDMKRRVAAIMDFISRTQVDLAAEASPSQSGEGASRQPSPHKTAPVRVNGDSGHHSAAASPMAIPSEPSTKDFTELNCIEMMDVLTRDMVKWQNQYS